MNVANARALEPHIAIAAGELGIQLMPPDDTTFDVVRALAEAMAARGVLVPGALTDAQTEEIDDLGALENHADFVRSNLERIAKGEP